MSLNINPPLLVLAETHEVLLPSSVILIVDIHKVRFAFPIINVQAPCLSSFHLLNLKSTESF